MAKILTYTVTVHHHTKDWRNGDLEDKFELIDSRNFKTRKAAKEFIERQLARQAGTIRMDWHKGDKPSYGLCFTGVIWQHENTGEKMEEYYQYTLKKDKLN